MAEAPENPNPPELLGSRPALLCFSGEWKLDKARSQPLEPMFEAMGVPWIARKLVNAVDVSTEIHHTPTMWYSEDRSSLGAHVTRAIIDGRWHKVEQTAGSGKSKPIKATLNEDSGDIQIESKISDEKKTCDIRRLLTRTQMMQILTYIKNNVPQHTVTRYFNKVESAEERLAGEEAESRIRAGSVSAASTRSNSGFPKSPVPRSQDQAARHKGRAASQASHSTGGGGGGDDGDHEASAASTAEDGQAESSDGNESDEPDVPDDDFSGEWKPDKSKSESLEPFLTELGVSWAARKIALRVEVTSVIKHTRKVFEITDMTKFGNTTTTVHLDNQPQQIHGDDGKVSTIQGGYVGDDNKGLRMQTQLPDDLGKTVDLRELGPNGDSFTHTLELYKNDERKCRIIRILQRQETPEAREERHKKLKARQERRNARRSAKSDKPKAAAKEDAAAAGASSAKAAKKDKSEAKPSSDASPDAAKAETVASGDTSSKPAAVGSSQPTAAAAPSSNNPLAPVVGDLRILGGAWAALTIMGLLLGPTAHQAIQTASLLIIMVLMLSRQ